MLFDIYEIQTLKKNLCKNLFISVFFVLLAEKEEGE